MAPGDVFEIWWPPASKYKIAVCIEPGQRLFLFINTDPPHAREAAVELRTTEFPLRWDSYIDTSKLLRQPLLDESEEAAHPNRRLGTLKRPLRDRIKACANDHGILPAWQKALVDQL